MDFSQKRNSKKIAFVDYIPAELKKLKEWRIHYYSKDPKTKKLVRFRIRVPKIKGSRERERYAKNMCLKINDKLLKGWCPFYEANANKDLKLLYEAIEQFNSQIDKQVKDGVKRPATLKSYSSTLNLLKSYLQETMPELKFCIDFNRTVIVDYLDYIYYDKKRSPRTCNNHLLIIKTLCTFMVERGYLKENPTARISKKPKTEKIRQAIPLDVRNNVIEYWKNKNSGYLTLCMCTYYCFIRRTELTKLKVKDVNLEKGFITIPSHISKNKKTEDVTIPNSLIPLLKTHIGDSNKNLLLFSNDFYVGKEEMHPDKITKTWSYMRLKLNLSKVYQFYSLKDTGITEMLNAGVPAIKVRDQARHHDLKITESYTGRNKGADDALKGIIF